MIFSKQELICFNSILDGKSILGIELNNEEIQDEDKYIEETIELLKEKSIVDENGKLTKVGILPIKALKEYKKAKEHISINMLRIGILEDDKIVVIDTRDNKYNISMSHKANILKEILAKSSFMRLESNKNDNFEIEKIPLSKILNKKDNYEKNSLLVKQYSCGCPKCEKIYYWDDNEGFEYDLINNTKLQLSSRKMRISLLKDLGLKYL